MKRKMVWVGVPWLAGLFLAAACQTSVTICLLLAALMLLGAFRLFRRITMTEAMCLGASFALAVGMVLSYTALVYQPIVSHADRPTTFSGRVTSVTVYDNDRASYQVRGEFSDGTNAKVLVYTEDIGARLGDDLQVAGTFSTLEDSYLWNTGAYYRAKSVFLQADTDAFVQCVPAERWSLIRSLQTYREKISLRIQVLSGTEAGGMISAMLLGTRDTLSEETKAVFSHNGISHVLSVSGLHLVLLLSIWMWVCKRFRFHRWLAFGTSVVWVVLYALMVSTPISILRAGLMFLLVQSAPLFYRRADTFHSLCLAGMVLTFGHPYLILDASFLLSIAGTFGIGVAAPWMARKMQKSKFLMSRLCANFLSMVCVSICIFPVTLLYFDEVSVLSPVANLFLVPICSLMLLISVGIFLTGGIGLVAKSLCFLLHLLYDLLMTMAYGLQAIVPTTFPTGWKLLPFLVGILVLFVLLGVIQKHSRRVTAISTLLAFVILLVGQTIYQFGERSSFQVTALGKGSNLVVVITYQGRTDVIDLTGNHRNPQYVQTYLKKSGIRHLTSLCLTKYADQMRVCYPETLREMTVENAVVSEACSVPVNTTLLGAQMKRSDDFLLNDTYYSISYVEDTVQIAFGTLRFCIGTSMDTVPDGNWDAVICTSWSGDMESLPEQTYQKEEFLQIRVSANGTVSITSE